MPAKKSAKKVAKKKTVSKKAPTKKTVVQTEEKAVEKESKTIIPASTEKVEQAVKNVEEVKKTSKKAEAEKAVEVVVEVKESDKKITKSTTKKTAPKKESKKSAKANVKKEVSKPLEEVKTDVTEEVVKKTAKKAPQKKTLKKAETKKSSPRKTTAKKTTKKKDNGALKLEQYNNFSLDTCIDMAKAMGVNLEYDDYANMLLSNTDLKKIAANIKKEYDLDAKGFTYEEDGFDVDVIDVLMNKVSETVELKAQDFVDMSSEADECIAFELSEDVTLNNEEYHKEFALVKNLLMLAQRKDLHTMNELSDFVKKDMTDFVVHYMDVAYAVIKNWQYEDVKYYENFIYAVLSQFTDLYEQYENRAMMDVADLYIMHGDYGLGDANYGYILRENSIKDLIYYRFANVYLDIDREKARSIAQSALQFVDGRFTYYSNIVEILEG